MTGIKPIFKRLFKTKPQSIKVTTRLSQQIFDTYAPGNKTIALNTNLNLKQYG